MTVPSGAPLGGLDASGGAAIPARLGTASSVFLVICPWEGLASAPVVPPFFTLHTEFKKSADRNGERLVVIGHASPTYIVVNCGPVGVSLCVQLLLLLGHHVVFRLLLFAHRPPLRTKETRHGQPAGQPGMKFNYSH